MKIELTYRCNTATVADILRHLERCSSAFYPPLADRVEVPAYAEQLSLKATTFEAWRGDDIIGLVAAYLNRESANAFISNVSVCPEDQGKGIGRELLRRLHHYLLEKQIWTIRLEVSSQATDAISLYQSIGYQISQTEHETHQMAIELRTHV